MGQCIPQVKLLYPDLTKRDISVSAIFGYYSRSNNTTDELIGKAWGEGEKPGSYVFQDFIEKWIIGYKHNSLSEHPSLHFYVENISNIATKILEANSMGQNGVPVAYMEKSTRYVNMENAKVFNVLTKYINELNPSESIQSFEDRFNKIIDTEIKMYNSRLKLYEEICEKNGVPKSKAFDSAREYLPSGISTIVGVSLNIRAVKEVIVNLLSNGNSEAYMIGEQLLSICCEHFGTIIKRNEIISRVTERATLLRKVLGDAYAGRPQARVLAAHVNPNYGFLKSIKPNEIIDFEEMRDRIRHDAYETDDNGLFRISDSKIMNLLSKTPPWHVVHLGKFKDVNTDVKLCSGNLTQSSELLDYILIHCSSEGVKIDVNDIPEFAFNNTIEIDVRGDYGSYRDIARHRKIRFIKRNFYSHSLVEKLYKRDDNSFNRFFTYYLEGIITESPTDSVMTSGNKASLQLVTYKYYIELTMDILDLIIQIKHLLMSIKYEPIETNLLLLEIMSYLLPMSTEKMYSIQCSLPDLLHLVQERIQPAGHLYYRSIASSIWAEICKRFDDADFTRIVNHYLSYEKEPIDGKGSIWKDVCLQIEDRIFQI